MWVHRWRALIDRDDWFGVSSSAPIYKCFIFEECYGVVIYLYFSFWIKGYLQTMQWHCIQVGNSVIPELNVAFWRKNLVKWFFCSCSNYLKFCPVAFAGLIFNHEAWVNQLASQCSWTPLVSGSVLVLREMSSIWFYWIVTWRICCENGHGVGSWNRYFNFVDRCWEWAGRMWLRLLWELVKTPSAQTLSLRFELVHIAY